MASSGRVLMSDVPFTPVDPALTKARLLAWLPPILVGALACAVAAWMVSAWLWIGVVAFAALAAWAGWLIPRQVANTGYRLTETDLIVRRGVMWCTVHSVPYGRLQYVDVEQGPLMKHFAIATVTLNTAALHDAKVPGLAEDHARELRDHLIARGDADLMGI